jgi:hypothetical protein
MREQPAPTIDQTLDNGLTTDGDTVPRGNPTGYVHRSYTSLDEWAHAGVRLGAAEHILWQVGDWYNDGENLGRGVRKTILESPSWRGPTYDTCKNAGRIARKFPPGSRYHDLPYTFYESVAALPADLAHALLDTAKLEKWSLNRTRLEAKRHRSTFYTKTGGDIVADLKSLIERGERFNAIYPDPPWKYGDPGNRGGVGVHYQPMTLDAICALPVDRVSNNTTTLFLWAPAALNEEAFIVMKAWRFNYARSQVIWHKTQEFGTGWRARMIHEHLLIGVRENSPAWADRAIPSVI